MNRDSLGLVECPCEQGFHYPVRLWEVHQGDVIHVANHYPVEIYVDDIPENARYALDLASFAWRGEGAEGITSLSPYALVGLVYRA